MLMETYVFKTVVKTTYVVKTLFSSCKTRSVMKNTGFTALEIVTNVGFAALLSLHLL